MRLYISGKKAWNASFLAEDGEPIYEAHSPSKIFGRTTTINRIVSDDAQSDPAHETASYLAQFTWKTFRSGRLRFHNREVRTRSFFKKKGWCGLHGRDRVFEINGCLFRWKLRTGIPELRLYNDPKTLVARYHPKGHKELSSPKVNRPCLDIMSGWKSIADDIVVSFVYIEKLFEDD